MRPPIPLMLEPEDLALSSRLRELADTFSELVMSKQPEAFIDRTLARLLTGAMREAGADEGTVWLASGQELVPIWNNGPDATAFVGSFRLPASEGITGMVFTTGLSACESEVCFQKRQNRMLDESLGVATWAMLAVPLKFLGEVRGVITAVRLVRIGTDAPIPRSREEWPSQLAIPAAFTLDSLSGIEHIASVVGQLLEHRLKSWALNEDA